MGSAPSPSLGAPTWEGQTPTDQAPLQSSNPPINYQGSYGQPSNNFQGMGKSPQTGGSQGLGVPSMGGPTQQPGMGVPQYNSNPIAQGAPMQQPGQAPMQRPGQSPYGQLGQFGGIDGAVNPLYMAMRGRPEMQQRYNDKMNSRPNIWG